MKTTFRFAFVAALLGLSSSAMADVDCLKLAVSVKNSVSAKPADVLQIVEKEVAANPSCACEVVKAAIEESSADAKQVAAIVETASSVAPEQMRLISQCAVAVAPDSLSEVQMVMARLDPSKGEVVQSSKDSKVPVEVKPAWNPLDFPGTGIGPNPGGPGGLGWLPPGGIDLSVPPIINPPGGTRTDYFIYGPVEEPLIEADLGS